MIFKPVAGCITIGLLAVLGTSLDAQTRFAASVKDNIATESAAAQNAAAAATGAQTLLQSALEVHALTAKAVADAASDRIDEQTGAPPSLNFNTLVEKGGLADLITTAIENAGTRTDSGALVTFRGKLLDLLRAAGGQPFSDLPVDTQSKIGRILGSAGFVYTLDTSQGSTQQLDDSHNRVAAVGARFELVNHRDARKRAVDHAQLLASQTSCMAPVEAQVASDPGFVKWRDQLARDAADAQFDPAKVRDAWEQTLSMTSKDVRGGLQPATYRALQTQADTCYAPMSAAWLREAAQGSLWTLEYTWDNSNAESVSNIRIIGETPIWTDIADWTFNGAITLFNKSAPAAAGAAGRSPVRDIQVSTEIDVRLGGVGQKIGTLTVGGKYQYIKGDFLSDVGAPILGNLTGSVVVGQAKLTLPLKTSGVSVPVSFTVSNRTELVKESDKRGFFGVSFDADKLFALVKR